MARCKALDSPLPSMLSSAFWPFAGAERQPVLAVREGIELMTRKRREKDGLLWLAEQITLALLALFACFK
jgi:hypothetical protein